MSALAALPVSPLQKDVSLFRLYLLRLLYLVWAAGLLVRVGPRFFPADLSQPVMDTVVNSVLIGLALTALVGLRYPLRMLPLMLFEITWKTAWLVSIGLPLWARAELDAQHIEVMKAVATVVVFPLVIPWGYVFRCYIIAPGDRWK